MIPTNDNGKGDKIREGFDHEEYQRNYDRIKEFGAYCLWEGLCARGVIEEVPDPEDERDDS